MKLPSTVLGNWTAIVDSFFLFFFFSFNCSDKNRCVLSMELYVLSVFFFIFFRFTQRILTLIPFNKLQVIEGKFMTPVSISF